jgi:hypothetical protein
VGVPRRVTEEGGPMVCFLSVFGGTLCQLNRV